MPVTEEGALTEVKRWNYAPETSALRGTPGTFINPRHYAETTRSYGRGKRANNTQMNSRRATYGSRPHAKTFGLDTKIIATEYLYSDYKQIFASAMGKELAASTLVLTAASGTVNGAILTSGTPDPIVRVGLSDGRFFIVPVKSWNSGTGAITWGVTLPSFIPATITSVQNANQRNGGCFVESLDPATSFVVETDQGAEPNQVAIRALACLPDISLSFDMGKHLEFLLHMTGYDWNDPVTSPPTQLTDVVLDGVADFPSWQCDVLFQSITTPALAVQQSISSLGIKFSSPWMPLDAPRGRLATGANPGSPTYNMKRGAPFPDLITMGMRLADAAWITKRSAKEKGQLFYCWYDGDPGQIGTRAIALHFRQAVLDDDPAEGDNGGITAHTLPFKIEDPLDADAVAQLKTRCTLSIFNN